MDKLEKAISGLEHCITQGTECCSCKDFDVPCPYYTNEARLMCWINLYKDALELLKEQRISQMKGCTSENE